MKFMLLLFALPVFATIEDRWLDVLVNTTLRRICHAFETIGRDTDFIVAVSGGKESIVLADLVLRGANEYCNVKPRYPPTLIKFWQDYDDEALRSLNKDLTDAFRDLAEMLDRPLYMHLEMAPGCNDTRIYSSLMFQYCEYACSVFLGVRSTDRASTDPVKLYEPLHAEYEETLRWDCYDGGSFHMQAPRLSGMDCVGRRKRVHPLFDWSYGAIWAYILRRGLPYPSAYVEGYTSIGSGRHPNPCLRRDDGSYRPAWELAMSCDERGG